MDTKELRAKAEAATQEDVQRERNLYMGKYRALLKLVSRTRDKLVQVTDHIEDEGDRAYFGSTNHADDLKDLYHEMMDWIWDSVDETNRMKSDPYADIRKQRARAEKAEAELERTRSSNEAMRKALEEIRDRNQEREFMGDDGSDGYGNEGWITRDGQYAKIARAALSPSTKVNHE